MPLRAATSSADPWADLPDVAPLSATPDPWADLPDASMAPEAQAPPLPALPRGRTPTPIPSPDTFEPTIGPVSRPAASARGLLGLTGPPTADRSLPYDPTAAGRVQQQAAAQANRERLQQQALLTATNIPRPTYRPQAPPWPSTRPEATTVSDRIKDVGLAALQGAISVPDTAVGLADIATIGRAGQALDALGYRSGAASAMLQAAKSPALRANTQAIHDATSILDQVRLAATSPDVLVDQFAQSFQSMLAGGAIGKGVIAAAPRIGGRVAAFLAKPAGAAVAAAIGEGAVTAGMNLEQVRQDPQNTGRALTPRQVAVITASGALTGAISAVTGSIAQKLGFPDVDTMIASAAVRPEGVHGLAARIAVGMVEEGALEELPQSAQEQIAQNIAQHKPYLEGVSEQAILGAFAGALMGGAGQAAMRPSATNAASRAAADLADRQPTVPRTGPPPSVRTQQAVPPPVVPAPVEAAPVAPPVVQPAAPTGSFAQYAAQDAAIRSTGRQAESADVPFSTQADDPYADLPDVAPVEAATSEPIAPPSGPLGTEAAPVSEVSAAAPIAEPAERAPASDTPVTAIEYAQRAKIPTKTIDWGKKSRGQGKRRGEMVMGAMSDAPTGIKHYPDFRNADGVTPEVWDEMQGLDDADKAVAIGALQSGLSTHDAFMLVYEPKPSPSAPTLGTAVPTAESVPAAEMSDTERTLRAIGSVAVAGGKVQIDRVPQQAGYTVVVTTRGGETRRIAAESLDAATTEAVRQADAMTAAPVDVNAFGESQPRLPGAETVREDAAKSEPQAVNVRQEAERDLADVRGEKQSETAPLPEPLRRGADAMRVLRDEVGDKGGGPSSESLLARLLASVAPQAKTRQQQMTALHQALDAAGIDRAGSVRALMAMRDAELQTPTPTPVDVNDEPSEVVPAAGPPRPDAAKLAKRPPNEAIQPGQKKAPPRLGQTSEGTARLQVRASVYRGTPGFAIRGVDTIGRQVSVFAETRGAAEHIKALIAAGRQPSVDDFAARPHDSAGAPKTAGSAPRSRSRVKPGDRLSGGGNASIGSVAKLEPPTAGRPPTTATLQGQTIRPVELPELVSLVKKLTGDVPGVVRAFRNPNKTGEFRGPGGIRLTARLFKAGHEADLTATMAHEIGHLWDWLPNKDLRRGNLLGHLYTLQNFLKHTFTGAGGEIKLEPVRQELLDLSMTWRPLPAGVPVTASHLAYRKSSKELYADAISVLLNDPGRLEQAAPTFYRELFAALDRKPEVALAYAELQQLLGGSKEELTARRREAVQQMAEAGEAANRRNEEARREASRTRARFTVEKTSQQLIEKHAPFYRRVRKDVATGTAITEDTDPRYALEERALIANVQQAWLERHEKPMRDRLDAAGIPWNVAHEVAFYERILGGDVSMLSESEWQDEWNRLIAKRQDASLPGDAPTVGDRADLANPLGITPKVAQSLLAAVHTDLGDEQWDVLQGELTKLRKAVKGVLAEAHEVGRLSDETWDRIKDNSTYATFQVIDHMDDPLTSRIANQIGTLKAVNNVLTATIEKTLVTLVANEYNRVNDISLRYLQQHHASEIEPAKTRWNGKTHEPIEPRDPDLGLVTVMREGKVQGYYVPQSIATSLNHQRAEANVVAQLLRHANDKALRPLFTSLNLGFQTSNVVRDFVRTWKTGVSVLQLLRGYRQAHGVARLRAFGTPTTLPPKLRQAREDLLQLVETRTLPPTFTGQLHNEDVEETRLDTLRARAGLTDEQDQAVRQSLARRIIEWLYEAGDYLETLPKAARAYTFAQGQPLSTLTPKQRSFVRTRVGTPDIVAGGTQKPNTNPIFLFSNVILQGWRSDLKTATERDTAAQWWWKTLAYNVAPKLLMAAATYGTLSGDDDDEDAWGRTLERMMRRVSEYDLANYLVVPIGEYGGKTRYIRLPQDDTGRVLGAVIWKALGAIAEGTDGEHLWRAARDVFGSATGNLPGVNPLIDATAAAVTYAAGQNPYDTYRGRNVLTDREQSARDWSTTVKFLKWEADNLGLGLLVDYIPDPDQTPQQKALADYLAATPVVGRWVKTSDYGEVERLSKSGAEVQRDLDRRAGIEQRAVNKALPDWTGLTERERTVAASWARARQIADGLYPTQPADVRRQAAARLRQRLWMGGVMGTGDPLTKAVLRANSNAEKVAIIREGRRTMSADAYRTWVQHARALNVLSADVQTQLARPPAAAGAR